MELNERRQFLSQLGLNRNEAHVLASSTLSVPDFNLRNIQRERFQLSVEFGDRRQDQVNYRIVKKIRFIVDEYHRLKRKNRPQTPPPPSNINWNENHETSRNQSAPQRREDNPRGSKHARRDNSRNQSDRRPANDEYFERANNDNYHWRNHPSNINRCDNDNIRRQNSQSFNRDDNTRETRMNAERNDSFRGYSNQNFERNEDSREMRRNLRRDDNIRRQQSPKFERNINFRQGGSNVERNAGFQDNFSETRPNFERNEYQQPNSFERNENLRQTGRNFGQNDHFQGQSRESFERNNNFGQTGGNFDRNDDFSRQQSRNFEEIDNYSNTGRNFDNNVDFRGRSNDSFERNDNFGARERSFDRNDCFSDRQSQNSQQNDRFRDDGRNFERNDNFCGPSRQNFERNVRFRGSENFDNNDSRFGDTFCNPNNDDFGLNQRHVDDDPRFENDVAPRNFRGNFENSNFRDFDQNNDDFRMRDGNFQINNNCEPFSNQNVQRFSNFDDDFGNRQTNFRQNDSSLNDNNDRFIENDRHMNMPYQRERDNFGPGPDFNMQQPNNFGDRFNANEQNFDCNTADRGNFERNFNDRSMGNFNNCDAGPDEPQNWNNPRSSSHFSNDNSDYIQSCDPDPMDGGHMEPMNQRDNMLENRQVQNRFMGSSTSQINRTGSPTITSSSGNQNRTLNNIINKYKKRAANQKKAAIPAKKRLIKPGQRQNASIPSRSRPQPLLSLPDIDPNEMPSVSLPNAVASAKLNGKHKLNLMSKSIKHFNNLVLMILKI